MAIRYGTLRAKKPKLWLSFIYSDSFPHKLSYKRHLPKIIFQGGEPGAYKTALKSF